MSFTSSYAAAKDPAFQNKVLIAMYKVAQLIAAEANEGYTQAWFDKRQALAKRVKDAGEQLVNQWALSVTSGGIVTAASPDDAIEFTVTSQWDAFAGVTDADKN